ncbi:uncharacterized protein LOC119338801 [Triticum dicoccoides]|uniref:uncharacterized protein LOC119338801 n=1 Tax=Triticum dicoccoides TaxID=85692 RepID=UPI00189100AE|nr:uncharacterized protein LOC119338801 [Triticum dicoccoides]XP_044434850.1 uncharacterized protein LOC123161058 isoform X2 [Triticum aestivum]
MRATQRSRRFHRLPLQAHRGDVGDLPARVEIRPGSRGIPARWESTRGEASSPDRPDATCAKVIGILVLLDLKREIKGDKSLMAISCSQCHSRLTIYAYAGRQLADYRPSSLSAGASGAEDSAASSLTSFRWCLFYNCPTLLPRCTGSRAHTFMATYLHRLTWWPAEFPKRTSYSPL